MPCLRHSSVTTRARFGLLQDADDLLFRKLLPLHPSVPSFGPDSSSTWRKKRGSRHLAPGLGSGVELQTLKTTSSQLQHSIPT